MKRPSVRVNDSARRLHRLGLQKARAAAHFALADRDAEATGMARAEDICLQLDGRTLEARLYSPADPDTALLVFFHGGGFIVGDIASHDALCRRLAAAAGLKVVSVAYRLAPEDPFPTQVDDALDSSAEIIRLAPSWGVDIDKIAIGGDSAGAYLALSACLAMENRFAAALLIYPLLHLDEKVWADSFFHDARVIGRLAVRYIRAQLQTVAVEAPSLLACDLSTAPPTIIISGGGLDPVRPDAAALAERLTMAGIACDYLEHALQPHGFLSLTHVSPIARKAAAQAGEMLRSRLKS